VSGRKRGTPLWLSKAHNGAPPSHNIYLTTYTRVENQSRCSERRIAMKTAGEILGSIVEPSVGELAGGQRIRERTKWLFDFVRNIMILGVLRYVSDRMGGWGVWIIYQTCFGIFVGYIVSYWWDRDVRVFRWLPWQRTGAILDFMLNVIIAVVIWFQANAILTNIVRDIAAAQMK
jgi:hypothetical protein